MKKERTIVYEMGSFKGAYGEKGKWGKEIKGGEREEERKLNQKAMDRDCERTSSIKGIFLLKWALGPWLTMWKVLLLVGQKTEKWAYMKKIKMKRKWRKISGGERRYHDLWMWFVALINVWMEMGIMEIKMINTNWEEMIASIELQQKQLQK